MAGLQRLWAAASGDTAALPAMAQTCLSSQGTPSIRAATGWVAKPLSVCRRDRHGRVNLPTTGHLAIGSILITVTPIWAVLAQPSSMYPELHLRSLCSRWAKIAMLICLTATISAVFPVPRTRRMWAELTEAYPLSPTAPAREHILVFIMTPARSGPTRLLRQIRLRSRLAGA
jgi:hypothetical protein